METGLNLRLKSINVALGNVEHKEQNLSQEKSLKYEKMTLPNPLNWMTMHLSLGKSLVSE